MAKNRDTEIVDWLGKNHVHITYYGSTPAVEITWFQNLEEKAPCPTCKHQKQNGTWPSYRGRDLREAALKAIDRNESEDAE